MNNLYIVCWSRWWYVVKIEKMNDFIKYNMYVAKRPFALRAIPCLSLLDPCLSFTILESFY